MESNIIQTLFIPLGILFTFLASIISIYFTTKNIRTQKYIDVITSQRIKWIETIRIEVSEIITMICHTLKFYKSDIEEDVKNNSFNDDENYMQPVLPYSYTQNALRHPENKWSENDFVNKLIIFKLRLNPVENKQIVDIVDYFITFYKDFQKKDINDINIASGKLDELLNQIQLVLKIEWEKSKKETKKI
jgi:hypothetical protein